MPFACKPPKMWLRIASGKFAVSLGFGGRTSPNAPNTRLLIASGASVGEGSVGGWPPEPALPLEPPDAPLPPEPPPPDPPPPPPPEHRFAGEAELRGATVALLRSAPLLSVSMQPRPARSAELVLSRVAVGALPSKLLAEEP